MYSTDAGLLTNGESIPKAETPAKKFEDGKDYVPTDGWTVFSHQFSSIAGAGPVTGAIQAAVFGWVPVFLWVI